MPRGTARGPAGLEQREEGWEKMRSEREGTLAQSCTVSVYY